MCAVPLALLAPLALLSATVVSQSLRCNARQAFAWVCPRTPSFGVIGPFEMSWCRRLSWLKWKTLSHTQQSD